MNNYLLRNEAPIQPETWQLIDSVVVEAAKSVLAGRRILNIEGPYGLGLKSVELADPNVKSDIITSATVPLSLIRKGFTLAKRDLAAYERDKVALDTSEAAIAAIDCAQMEDNAVFQGTKGTPGLTTAKGTNGLGLAPWDNVGTAAEDIIKSVNILDEAGFHGPYSLALAPRRYNLLLRRYPNGPTELEHIGNMAAQGVVKAPALNDGGVLLASGRQFASIVLGQDLTAGFIGPVGERLEFSVSESLTLLIRQPKAICVLKA
ncbi:MAG: bacteriocin family protein [Chloroflexi bacterium]|nr:bacteriocin family protein [Chloroflexota bacterium]